MSPAPNPRPRVVGNVAFGSERAGFALSTASPPDWGLSIAGARPIAVRRVPECDLLGVGLLGSAALIGW